MIPILTQSFWRDEAFTVLLSEKSPLTIIQISFNDPTPPFYYLILHFWMLFFGNNEVTIRGLSFILHTMTALTVFLTAKKLLHTKLAASLTALAVFLNPFLLQYGFEARGYSMLVLSLALAVYFAIINRMLFAGFFLGLGMLTHNFGLFNMFTFTIWWIFVKRESLNFKAIISFFAFPALAFMLWGSIVLRQWGLISETFWISKPTFSTLLQTYEKFVQGEFSYPAQPLLFWLTSFLLVCSAGYIFLKKRGEDLKYLFLFMLLICIPITITFVISIYRTPIYYERYLISSVPMLILLASYALYQLYLKGKVIGYTMLVFVLGYIGVLMQVDWQIVTTSTKPPIRTAIEQVLSQASDNDVVIPKDVLNFLETKYYVRRKSLLPVFAYTKEGKVPFYIGGVLFEKQDIIKELPQGKRIWLILPDGKYEQLSTRSI